MITTDQAGILFDPLKTSFDVDVVGGLLTQRYNSITHEFESDRTLFPVALRPRLQVTDPNIVEGEQSSDKTASLTANWYRTVDGEEVEITATSGDYHLDGKNLVVEANVTPGENVALHAVCQFVNPNTLEVLKFEKRFNLSTQTFVEYNPDIKIDASNYTVVSPFRTTRGQQRVLTGKFFAGAADISTDSHVRYLWEKKDGTGYRAITETDVEVAAVSGRLLTLNMDCVGDVTYRLTGWHTEYPSQTVAALATFHRQYSGYSVRIRTVKGKILKNNVTESVAEAVVAVNSNEIANPGDYFRFLWRFYRQHGTTKEGNTIIGNGATARADRSLSGYDKTRVPTFQLEYVPVTEYRLLYSRATGNPICTQAGNLVVGQVLKEDFEEA